MNVYLYFHNGSGNHGCEALVRSTLEILKQECAIVSTRLDEDQKYGISLLDCDLLSEKKYNPHGFTHICIKIISIIRRNTLSYTNYAFSPLLKRINKNSIALSMGGDTYCYGNTHEHLAFLNKRITTKGAQTVLWGCSLEPNLLQFKTVRDDMKRYKLITTRESITYDALQEAGIKENVFLFPDPAFILKTESLPLPVGFIENNTVGINVSPLIISCEKKQGTTMQNYIELILHIIKTTDMQIALIPHVVWENNDDQTLLTELYKKFAHTERVVLIDDHNCMELKGYISRCRMFIGARTHSTIAAYSTCVPTLVVGYSVKAKGIAKDIFGTYENYVIPVQILEKQDDLVKAFEWLKSNEESIRTHLNEFMPSYCAATLAAGKEISKLMRNRE